MSRYNCLTPVLSRFVVAAISVSTVGSSGISKLEWGARNTDGRQEYHRSFVLLTPTGGQVVNVVATQKWTLVQSETP